MDRNLFGEIRRRRNEGRMDPSLDRKRQQQLMEFLQKKSEQHQGKTARFHDDDIELTLPEDLFFKIFLLVPAESLSKLQFVSKKWFSLINSSMFIEFQAKQTETVLMSKELFLYEPHHPLFPPEAHPVIEPVLKPRVLKKPTRFFHFVDFDDGSDNFIELTAVVDMINVSSSCNGLILGKIKEIDNLMVVINPLTRKYTRIPSGTIDFDESYTLVFCCETRTYKVVHLFRERTGYTGCEIYDISTRKWTFLDGPRSDLLQDVRQTPVSVGGSLFWMQKSHGGTQYLSMNVMRDEKFVSKDLPVTSAASDRLVEFGGVVGFVTHATLNLIHVWILTRGRGSEEKWIKQHSIYQGIDATRYLPICSSRNGKEMVFEYVGGDLYAYNFEKGVMKKICSRNDELRNGHGAEKLFIPHRNTLVWLDWSV